MTEKESLKFEKMRNALLTIAKGYMTPDQLRKQCGNRYGVEYAEALEMAYENIQETARLALRK